MADTQRLRLHGSNTIGASLAIRLSKAFLREKGVHKPKFEETTPNESVLIGTLPDPKNTIEIEIHSHGSSTGFADLNAGVCDIGMASRAIHDDEILRLSRFGDMTSTDCEHVFALDGVAVLVNTENPLTGLSVSAIREIFAGKTRGWEQVAGISGPITVLARDEKSGTWDTFKSLVLGTTPLSAKATRYESNSEIAEAIANDTGGIGFVGLSSAGGAKTLRVGEGDLVSMDSSPFNVATEDYLLSRRLYFYSPAKSENPLVREFLEFSRSEEGQRIVDDEGFVSLAVHERPASHSDARVKQHPEYFRDAVRLSVTLRFLPNETRLDTRSERDLQRLADYILDGGGKGARVSLFGFSDPASGEAETQWISSVRAVRVDVELTRLGVTSAVVKGLGADYPVASNQSPSSRSRNRRVEVWLRR